MPAIPDVAVDAEAWLRVIAGVMRVRPHHEHEEPENRYENPQEERSGPGETGSRSTLLACVTAGTHLRLSSIGDMARPELVACLQLRARLVGARRRYAHARLGKAAELSAGFPQWEVRRFIRRSASALPPFRSATLRSLRVEKVAERDVHAIR